MEKRFTLRYNICAESEGPARKKGSEVLNDFRKTDLQLAIVDFDEQLKQLGENYGNISKVRARITIQEIRNRLGEICSLALYGVDLRRFASHEPDDKTPLNSSRGRCY